MDSTPWVERYAWFGVMENLEGVNSVSMSVAGEYFNSFSVRFIMVQNRTMP